ncbi:unnamed protein product, partial [Sphacelaria rigidula]
MLFSFGPSVRGRCPVVTLGLCWKTNRVYRKEDLAQPRSHRSHRGEQYSRVFGLSCFKTDRFCMSRLMCPLPIEGCHHIGGRSRCVMRRESLLRSPVQKSRE